MKWLLSLVAVIFIIPACAQSFRKPDVKKERPNSIGFSLSIPMGYFSSTHTIGFVADYTRTTRSFLKDSLDFKLIRFAMNGGASYHGGKRVTTAGYEFTYEGYINIYAMAGIDCKPADPIVINLTTGPVLSIYEGSSEFGFGVNLLANYFISPMVAAGPGIQYRKFAETDALWSAIFRISYNF